MNPLPFFFLSIDLMIRCFVLFLIDKRKRKKKIIKKNLKDKNISTVIVVPLPKKNKRIKN